MDRSELEGLDRDSLIHVAVDHRIPRAKVLTRPELIDEILLARARTEENPGLLSARGFFGRARDLVARVVERGLHLPDALERLRANGAAAPASVPPGPPMPTVTLAEMYAAQGHLGRAVETLQRVLEEDPEAPAARLLLERLALQMAAAAAPSLFPPPSTVGRSRPPGPPSALLEGVAHEPGPSAAAGEPGTARLAIATSSAGPRPAPSGGDACVALPVDPTTLFVLWRVAPRTLEHLARTRPHGRLTLRLLVIVPSWNGPVPSTRDLDAATGHGEITIRHLPRGCVARVVVGWRSGDDLVPVAQSPAFEVPTGQRWPVPVTSLLRRSGRGVVPVTAADVDLPVLALALERAATFVQ